jgi:hypothetical protein
MIQVTLTNVNQLLDYTHINQYIVFTYQNENANHQYFGNFSESTRLMNNDALIQVLDVESVHTSESEDGTTNFVMNSNAPIRVAGSDPVPLIEGTYGHTLAFNEITDHMRFDVVTTSDTHTLLVLYQKYVPKKDDDTTDLQEEVVNNSV